MFQINGLNLFFNGKVIYRTLDEIYKIIYQDDNQAIIRYRSLGYANYKGYMEHPRELWTDVKDEEDFKLINRNVLCVNKDGSEIWRIEAPELERRADSFLHVSFNEINQKWEGRTSLGHEFDLDIETGKLSNIRYDAVK